MPSVRSVALGFWIGTGSAGEAAPEAGLSHLIEHMVFRGTARFESVEIDQIFDGMGAVLNAGTGKETTSVYSRVLDVHLEEALDVMAAMVWSPRFGAAGAAQGRRGTEAGAPGRARGDRGVRGRSAGQGLRRPGRGGLRRSSARPRDHR